MANEVIFDPTLMDTLDEDTTALPAEFDSDADAYAPPPPLPDGWHMATLSIAGVKDENGVVQAFRKRGWGKNIASTFHTAIAAKVVDPGGLHDGKMATDNTVITFPDPKQHNTSKVATLYRGITGKPIPGVTEGAHMKAFIDVMQTSPTVWVKTQLEGQPQDAGKAFSDAKKAGTLAQGQKAPKTYRGEKAFMENGKLTGRAWDEASNEWVVGRPSIVAISKDAPAGK